jgi:hypothetical protein
MINDDKRLFRMRRVTKASLIRCFLCCVLAALLIGTVSADERNGRVLKIVGDTITFLPDPLIDFSKKEAVVYPEEAMKIDKDCKFFRYLPDPEAVKLKVQKDWIRGAAIPDGLNDKDLTTSLTTAAPGVGRAARIFTDKANRVVEAWIGIPKQRKQNK